MQPKLSFSLAALAIGLTAPAIAAQEAREFQATRMQIAEIRRISTYDYGKYYASEELIADAVNRTCRTAKNEGSLDGLMAVRRARLNQMSQIEKAVLIDLLVSSDLIALKLVCPEYEYMLPR
ncbi:hypothetical protein NIES2135_32350 [Leptolyngbya boryana NIES-2135]|jgi:hypothetical protein|uniref:DUF732 domain-containing protein n=1 Tax=Leptolyngbya boryana NIES-2135 TaxID=1973484 RepID=A0A1Z4JI23_LEPBY|nr:MULTISPECIES: hypothetical protein [Leptolyngbya]BAY56404.1 hypothetical protein NIES2135_32350 [Leptolyngbya boryana NIES-2135]MBD2366509.1 hypothetical protein [Leptolyngbya sp. FACHB-161]MBD2372688.1 hypothetical protein [Leptolyngbya sp. FACHB-238]MBD2397112.1 hypothetical protein [Leptolyngbya sp. FACHB-239]MBD2403635.1 hypothetical protein [Leptolyngbya sp. FACHB-402]